MFCRFASYIFVIYSRKNDIFYFYPHRYVKQTMQSDEEETALHSCFGALKSAVMGCCYSLCQKDNDPQVRSVSERTHLLEAEQQRAPAPAAAAAAAGAGAAPPRKPDEQSALNRILSETATNVIDVGALGPYALEAGAYSERVRLYTARVGGGGGGAGAARLPPPPPRLLLDLPAAERAALLAAPPLSAKDRDLIGVVVRSAAAALSELRVRHLEDLVVPFRVP